MRSILFGLWAVVTASAVHAQTSFPMLVSLKPVAAQIGQSSEHTLQSIHSMYGANQVIVSGTGVTGEIVSKMEPGKDGKPPNMQQLQLRFTVAADARPGVRDFRIISPVGPSTIGQLLVVTAPVISEKDPNDTREQAMPVTLPGVLCGTIEKSEDVDLFKFTVNEPSNWTFHVEAMRLEDKIHDLQTHVDPIITIRSANGSTVAAADNRYAADPLLKCRIEHPGDYFVEIRDVRYEGNANWVYAVEASPQPFVTTVHPLAVEPGTNATLQLNGWEPAGTSTTWSVPAGLTAGIEQYPLPGPAGPTNPVAVVINDLTPVLETAGDNNSPATGQKVSVPSGISGRIDADSDIDCYTFEAKKGDVVAIEAISRRAGSLLDPIISILNDKGGRLIENDDLRAGNLLSQDAAIESWTAPADGNYTIEIRDLHLRGGADFVYHIRLTRPEPTFSLTLDSDKTPIVPGGCTPIFVRVTRKNGFDGEVALDIQGLPPGVTATCGRILKAPAIDGAIILAADPSASAGVANITVTGRGSVKAGEQSRELTVAARPQQEIYMPGGGRSHWPMQLHTVSIAPMCDLRSIKVTPSEVTLKPGESVALEVEIVRAEGFDKNVTLDMVFQHLGGVFANSLPPGVKIDAKASQTALSAKETKGKIVLTAEATAAPTERQLACVMGQVSINFVMKSATCSPPVWVSVKTP